MWIFRNAEAGFLFEKYSTDKTGIGSSTPRNYQYAEQSILLNSGDCVLLFSDGAADQFGGPEGKKLMSSGLRKLFLDLLMAGNGKYEEKLEIFYKEWMSGEEQTDDILLLGFIA